MSETPAQSLCCQCGLCCDGSIFEDVELAGKQEATAMECLGIECDDEEGRALLIQPCRGLKEKRCQVYEYRPECCRTFECQVLKDFDAGRVSMADSIRFIEDVRKRLANPESSELRSLINQRFLGFLE